MYVCVCVCVGWGAEGCLYIVGGPAVQNNLLDLTGREGKGLETLIHFNDGPILSLHFSLFQSHLFYFCFFLPPIISRQSHLLHLYLFLYPFFPANHFSKSSNPILYLLFPHYTLNFSNRSPHSAASTILNHFDHFESQLFHHNS